MKFRKKPVEVEAVPVADAIRWAANDWQALPEWLRDAYEDGKVIFLPDAVLVRTLEGEMRGERADWLIQGVQREVYPCKPDIFAETYGPA